MAHFLPARVATDATGTYLDVASFTLAAAENGGVPQPDAWFEPANSGPGYIFKYTSTVPSGATPAPDSTPKDPLFWGGTAACRKRLNTRYIPVSTDYATVSWDPNKTGNILAQTQGSDVVGPLAVEFPSEYTLPNGQPSFDPDTDLVTSGAQLQVAAELDVVENPVTIPGSPSTIPEPRYFVLVGGAFVLLIFAKRHA